ncbi:MAG TPA: hypothetical protein VMX13_03715 [Sedimentisphaerales bacterium]|nr:hypothetical protein [Sedimentisphaerales bacterium]
MEVHLRSANFTRGGQEYVLSCLFMISPGTKPGEGGKTLAAKVKDVVCTVRIRRKRKPPRLHLYFN